MNSSLYVLVIFVPTSHADAVRQALARTGASKIGNYDSCSFTSTGTGRFRPLQGSNPAIGSIGEIEEVAEERIEVVIPKDADLKSVLQEVKRVHPYEEPAIQLVPMVDYRELL